MKFSHLSWVVLSLSWSCQEQPKTLSEADNFKIDYSNSKDVLPSTPGYNFLTKDIPLGTDLAVSELKHYSYFGQFIDDGLLDFYTAEYPGFDFLSVKPESIVLEYQNGVLRRKRYSFRQDISAILQKHYFRKAGNDAIERVKIINLNFVNKKITYYREPPFLLYETLKSSSQ